MSKISEWGKENKIRFNEQKSEVMLMTRRKRKERKERGDLIRQHFKAFAKFTNEIHLISSTKKIKLTE